MPDASKLIADLKAGIAAFSAEAKAEKVGAVIEAGDGIARLTGLSECLASEMLAFPDDVYGVALNLEEETVGAMILGDATRVREGDVVRRTGSVLSVPVGEGLVGRVVDPLGRPLDGKGAVAEKARYPVEKVAPGVLAREPVNTPLQTGIKAIDAMIPIGRGQRELIIGDRQTGKTAVAVDTIVNQKGKGVVCVYVAIGQKESKVARIVAKLEETGALAHTIVVVAGASVPAALQYIAPYAGCAMGEYFMDQGKDALVVYDDLSKHAWAYRQISLLLRRPPGREAYPGDIFYLHSRLLERAARMSAREGGGSLTALPIIETQSGDVSAYIPTNVISITDGQIYLETDLFYRGVRPALNVGLSVSRVGGAAQLPAMKKVAGRLRLDLAQFRELEAFAQFSTDLEEGTRKQIERGRRIVEVLKQPQYEPLPVGEQVAVLYAVTNGYLDAVPVDSIAGWEERFRANLKTVRVDVVKAIAATGALSEKTEAALVAAIKEIGA